MKHHIKILDFINQATVKDLIPVKEDESPNYKYGIGDILAERIIKTRDNLKEKKFQTFQELIEIKGLGTDKIDALKYAAYVKSDNTLSNATGKIKGGILDLSNYELAYDSNFSQHDTIHDLMKEWNLLPNPIDIGWGDESYSPGMVSFLENGGIRLHAIDNTYPTVTHPWGDTSQQRNIKYISGMIQSNGQTGTDDTKAWQQASGDTRGFLYGIFEANIKLTKDIPGVWPAFWFFSGSTEIDIIDNLNSPSRNNLNGVINWMAQPQFSNESWRLWDKLTPYTGQVGIKAYDKEKAYYQGNQIHFEGWIYQAKQDISRMDCGVFMKSQGTPLWNEKFNKFSMAWNPNEVSFFLNGILINTVPYNEVHTFDTPASFLFTLQVEPWAGKITSKDIFYDIDYFKVYKPIQDTPDIFDYTKPYIENYNLFDNNAPLNRSITNVDGAVVESLNGSKIYYRGKDCGLYNFFYQSGRWNHSILNSNQLNVKGEILVTDDSLRVFYHNSNDSIDLLEWDAIDKLWIHSQLVANTNLVKDNITLSMGGNKIFYRGIDNRLYNYYYNGTNWQHASLDMNVTNVASDVIVSSNSNKVYYRGDDNKLYNFYFNNGWHHSPLNNSVANVEGEIQIDENTDSVYYKGTDNKMYVFFWNSTSVTWNHQVLDSTINNVSHDVQVDKISGKLYYISNDNRLCTFFKDGNSWKHEFILYDINDVSHNLIVMQGGNRLFYISVDGRVKIFNWTKGWYHMALSCPAENNAKDSLTITSFGRPYYRGKGDRIWNFWHEDPDLLTNCHDKDVKWCYQ